MVQWWIKAGCPIPEDAATHTVSNRWASTIDGILRVNGYHGFLSNFDDSEQAFDTDYAAVAGVAAQCNRVEPTTATGWAKKLQHTELLGGRLRDEHGKLKPLHARATMIGSLFNRYVGRTFQADGREYRLRRRPDKDSPSHEPPEYWFEGVEENTEE